MNYKVKTREEISKCRTLAESGIAIEIIAQQMGFSQNTVKKIVYRIDGYEGDVFNHSARWPDKWMKTKIYVSPIDRERIRIQSATPGRYPRSTYEKQRCLIHIHEAQKAYRILGLKWPLKPLVHHKDCDETNFSPFNLVVFRSNGFHRRHHLAIQKAMHEFIQKRNLMDEFYIEHPNIKENSIGDLLAEHQK